MLVFVEVRKPENPEKTREQGREPKTNSNYIMTSGSGVGSRVTFMGSECSHLRAIPALQTLLIVLLIQADFLSNILLDTDPGSWPGLCNLASSKKQTPIDIETSAVTYDKDLGEFTLTNYDTTPANTKFTALNNGHSLKISFPENVYNVSGGGLTGVYTTVQFHLHWGSVNTQGSEHTMDGKEFAAELHFVSYNTKYPNISMAVDKADGLAVLGVFIKVEGDNNTAYSFLDYARDVVYKCDEKAGIPAFKFKPMLPANLTKYYRYHGSLTTPDCFESVTWTVFKDVVKISPAQMDMLRMLKDANNKTLVDNYRPIQPLNGRVVNSSFMEPEPPTTDMTTVTSTPTDTSTVIPPITANAIAITMTNGLYLLMLLAAIFVR